MSALPRGWVKARISDVYNVSRGGSPRPIKDFVTSDPDGLNWIRIADASAGGHRIQAAEQKIDRRGLNKTREVFPGDLLLSNSMSFGRPYITDIQGCIHDGWLVLGGPATSHIDAEFAYRCLSSPKVQRQFDEKASGTTVRNLNTDLVSSVHIEIPPLAEQKRIVAKLDALNAKSARARTELARIETLVSRYKQAVLSKAFSGELTNEWRHDGEWPVPVRLGDVAGSFAYGSAAKSQKSGSIPVLRMGNIQNGKLDWTDLVYTDDKDEIDKYRLVPGDVLFNRTNSPALVGKTALYNGERDAIFAGYLIRIVAGPHLDARYLTYALNSPSGREFSWNAKTDGVSQSNISASKLKEFAFAVPPLEEQHEIVRRIESAFARIDRLAKEAKRALELVGRLDEAILAKAFRGELVPQDENDEPAEHLLARIRAERETAPKGKRGRGAKG